MKKLDILHADDDVILVNKPSGMLTIPARFDRSKASLQELLQAKYGTAMTVHRLDRETSGILIFARNEAAHKHLSMQFQKHSTDKFYLGLVDGVVHHEEGEIDKPIGEHPQIKGKMHITNRGKASLTFYRVLEHFKNFTLLEAQIKTGRTHQIRVHFQSIGYPLAVDALYGRREGFMLSEIKGRKFRSGKFSEEERPLMSRTALHAYRLRFDHPTTGERLTFVAEPPKDLSAVLKQLRKWGK